jgi:hypothetical protein
MDGVSLNTLLGAPSMAVNVQLAFGGAGSVRESLSIGYAAGSSVIQWGDLINQTVTLTDSTTPPVQAAWGGLVSLSAGTVTLDLTALTRTGQSALDLTGMSVIAFVFRNLGAAVMTIEGAVTNPYELFGSVDGEVVVSAGGMVQVYQGAGLAAVAGAVKAITVAGTGTQQFALVLAAGDLTP